MALESPCGTGMLYCMRWLGGWESQSYSGVLRYWVDGWIGTELLSGEDDIVGNPDLPADGCHKGLYSYDSHKNIPQ